MEKAAAIYTRISDDSANDGLGVRRQETDARALCKVQGWTVVEVFCDNDRSAFDPRKTRPRYQAMLDAVRARRIDTIVAWHPDRLHRQSRELVPFIDLVQLYGVHVETVTAGTYDLSSPTGRMNARMVGAVAEFESEHKSERIRRKLEANAAEGLHHGGSRPFGWLDDRVTVDDTEAVTVRESAALVLAGSSLRQVVKMLNASGHKTATGLPWRDVTARTMLLRPRNAGLRLHHGEIVGPGRWEPILSPEDFHQVVAVLTDPRRRTTPGRDGQVHLLSVIARCGVCGGPMTVAKSKPYKGRSNPIYRCKSGHVIRSQASVDETVSAVIVGRLNQPDAAVLLANVGNEDTARRALDKAEQLRERMSGAAEAYAVGSITLSQLTSINAAVRPALEQAEADSFTPDRAAVLGTLVSSRDPAKVWATLPNERRRAVIDLLMTVRILPTGRGRTFDPSSVEIRWK